MRIAASIKICLCAHLQKDHLGFKGRCQHQPSCAEDCQKFVKSGRGNKYGASRQIGGADSKLEASRFADLALLLKAGEIRDLEIHPRLEVQPEGCATVFFKVDAHYFEKQKHGWVEVYEDAKGSSATMGGRFPVVWKLLRHRHPTAILRIAMREKGRWVFKDDPPRVV